MLKLVSFSGVSKETTRSSSFIRNIPTNHGYSTPSTVFLPNIFSQRAMLFKTPQLTSFHFGPKNNLSFVRYFAGL
jgi:hypothetical protein